MDEQVIELAGKPIRLVRPRSYAARMDVVMAASGNTMRAMAAALGLCWAQVGAGVQRPLRTTLAAHKYDALAYGGAVLDELLGVRGVSAQDLAPALTAAWQLCTADLITAEEVAEAEDFTGATPTGQESPG